MASPTDDARGWIDLAQGSLRAARLLLESPTSARSAANRAYYAAYQAVHALAFGIPNGPRPPEQGNWKHKSLPGVLRACLQQVRPRAGIVNEVMRLHLEDLQRTRGYADYNPSAAVDDQDAKRTVKHSMELVRLVEAIRR